jgi:hypothetical protein
MKQLNSRVVIAVILPLLLPINANADSMQCNGNVISSGDTVQTVLQNCGEPTSRNGNQWVYQSSDQDNLSNIVTFTGGVVDSIRAGNFPGFQNTPFEDAP